MCCKLLYVQEIAKPANVLCSHCSEGGGCRIYQARPLECRLFYCDYLRNPQLSEQWRPSKSGIVVSVTDGGRRIAAMVDPERADAWRREPFYSTLKRWSREAVQRPARTGQVIVTIGTQSIVILPDRDVDVGTLDNDHLVITEAKNGPEGVTFDAYKISRSDPRAVSILGTHRGIR